MDDGSSDRSPDICDDYAKMDNRIKVIHKVNGGLSDARNCGLKASKGNYVIFLDSDDTICKTACEQINHELETNDNNIDIVICNTKRIENSNINILNRYDKMKIFDGGEEFLLYAFENSAAFSFMAPNNIYNREFLIKNNLYFEKGIFHEDERWTPIVILKSQKILNTNICFYNYFIRENSITTTKKKTKHATDLIETIRYLTLNYQNITNKQLQVKLLDYLAGLYLHAIYIGDLSNNSMYIDKKLCKYLAHSAKNKIKSGIFRISPRLYCFLRKRKG